MNESYLVYVDCPTYNQSSFIKDSMDGFCMQETVFPYVCGIVDDASTDGAQDVIKHYLGENFNSIVEREETDDYIRVFAQHKSNENCYFVVFSLKYNHYQNKKTRHPYISEWKNRAKYIALCEGDDYWISSNKLQRQVELLENNKSYSLVCNRTKLFSIRQNKFIGENYCYDESRIADPEDVINRTGLFISTCSILFRTSIYDGFPSYCSKCLVGDYPMQILCALRGGVFYINDTMSVYRVENPDSWMGNQKWGQFDKDRLEVIKSRVEMLKGFQKDFPSYNRVFGSKIADEINRNIPGRLCKKKDVEDYLFFFLDEIKQYSLRWKIDLWLRRCRIPRIRVLYTKLFLGKYSQRRKLFD